MLTFYEIDFDGCNRFLITLYHRSVTLLWSGCLESHSRSCQSDSPFGEGRLVRRSFYRPIWPGRHSLLQGSTSLFDTVSQSLSVQRYLCIY